MDYPLLAMGFSLRTTDSRLPEEDTGPGGDRGCRFCNIMMALPRLVTDGCFHKSRQAARRHPPGMKMAALKFVPLGKGTPRILRQGVLVEPTPTLKHHPSQEEIFGGLCGEFFCCSG